MKALIEKIEAWLANNNVKKVSNLLICAALLIFGKHFLAGIFFGLFVSNNSDLFKALWEKLKALFVKKEQEVVAKVETAVKAEEAKVVDAVKAEEKKVVDAVKSKI